MSIQYEIKKENLNKIPDYFIHNLFINNKDKYKDILIFKNGNISIKLAKNEFSFSITGIYPNTYKFDVTISDADTSEFALGYLKIVTCRGAVVGGDILIYYDPYDWLFSALKIFENNLYYFLSYYKKVIEETEEN